MSLKAASKALKLGLGFGPSRGAIGLAERVAGGVTMRTMSREEMAARAALITVAPPPKPNRRARRAAGK